MQMSGRWQGEGVEGSYNYCRRINNNNNSLAVISAPRGTGPRKMASSTWHTLREEDHDPRSRS